MHLFEIALSYHWLARNQEILMKVYDVTNTSDPLIMYGRQTQDGNLSRARVSLLNSHLKQHYAKMTAQIGEQVQIVGDGLFVTNPKDKFGNETPIILSSERFRYGHNNL